MNHRSLIITGMLCASLALISPNHAQELQSRLVSAEEWEMIQKLRAEKEREAEPPPPVEVGSAPVQDSMPVQDGTPATGHQFFAGYRALYRGITEKGVKIDEVDDGDMQKVVGFIAEAPTEQTGGFLPAIAGNFRLRREWNGNKEYTRDGSGVWREDGSAQDAKPAEFAWTRDGSTDADYWKASGVIYYPLLWAHSEPERANHEHPAFILSPSVEFNRDTSKDGGDDAVNSLIFRLGADVDIPNPFTNILNADCVVLRVAVGYQTDFDFESETLLTELELAPQNREAGLNTFNLPRPSQGDLEISGQSRWFYHKITAKPLLTLGDVMEDGGKLALAELDGNYFQAGFEAGLDVRLNFLPKSFNRTTIGATYRWWSDVGSDSTTYDYTQVAVAVPILSAPSDQLSAGDRMFITAFYRKGNKPVTLEEEDLTGITLGVKF